ncbi:MAG: T9SS type A sorting domain-containing protein [Bacteroidota bacterium]|nr:T9SS type A sorting domain-containing protein [Bacteroidota bacterium]
MGQYAGTFGTVNLNGGFNGWCGSCAEMTDDDGDNIYEITVEGLSGSIEYKFTLDGWTAQEEFAGGEPCTLTTGEFTNRFYAVDGDVTLDAVCWNMCTLCNAEPVPGCTDATACNYNADATEDDGSCVYGEGPNAGFTVMDALCHDGMGSVMLDSATVDIAGATFSVGGMAIENGMMEIAAGTHMLVATGADGCSNETEFTVNAPEELVIEVTLVSQDSGAGDGQASAEVSGGTPDYVVVWTNMTGIEVSPDSLASGLYTAIATDANGCTASASLTMTVDGIEDVLSLEGAVFPVPVVDQLNIRLATPLLGDATVDVRDMQGRLVATLAMRTAQQHIVIDAASWEAGVYSVQISTEGARASWSFVK